MTIDQVVGFCDDNESRTDYFRYTTTTAGGKSTVTYAKGARGGKRVKVERQHKQKAATVTKQ